MPSRCVEAKPKVRRTKAARQAREQATTVRYFTWAEVASLVAAAPAQLAAMILVTARTGLRLGEVLALRWSAIDGDWLNVTASWDKTPGESAPKSGKARRVPLEAQAAQTLAALRERGEYVGDGDLVFPSSTGTHLDPDNIGEVLRDLQREVRIYTERRNWQGLRHTFGTYAAEVYPLPNVQEWMGHEDIQTTMPYVHAVDAPDAPARLGEKWAAIAVPAVQRDVQRTTANAA